MPRVAVQLAALLIVCVAASAGCVTPHRILSVVAAPTGACHAVQSGDAIAPPVRLRWQSAADGETWPALARWCDNVGPAVVIATPAIRPPHAGPLRSLVVASWNIHVGGGDLPAFVAALKRGDLTGGQPVADFVLLLQEAYRAGPAVPPVRYAEAVPGRIDPAPPSGSRRDIVVLARTLGLSLVYVPSMRNGADPSPGGEDRGNAILSTLPLSDVAAIELPFQRQRRVAAVATVGGSEAGLDRSLRFVSAHLDATGDARHLRVFASGLRARQARALADRLGEEGTATVLGSDLNTWWRGADEPAYQELRRVFPGIQPMTGPTHWGGLMLDYVFFRLPADWQGDVLRVDRRFGSDHSPLVGRIGKG